MVLLKPLIRLPGIDVLGKILVDELPRHDLGLASFTGHWMPEEAIVKPQVPGVGVNGFFSVTKKVQFFSNG